MKKSEVDELFVLHHQDLSLSDEEIDDLIEESSWQQRARWLDARGYSTEEGDHD
jgi:hypothetical protein